MVAVRSIPVTLIACILFAGCNQVTEPESKPQPNVVFVLADQLRSQATGYNGDPNLVGKTPNLDRLADQSINFRNAFSVTPVCTPYRAALLTGQFPTTTGMIFNDVQLPGEALTMAEIFKESGYKTAYIGKWHLDGMGRDQFTPPERRQGFEYWKALECSHSYKELYYYEGNDPTRKQWEGYGPYAETADAIGYIHQNAKQADPFLLFLSLGTPHFPYHNTPDDMEGKFKPEEIILRDNVTAEYDKAAREQSAGYYAHILGLDKCLGQLQSALEEAGIAENTIFVFTSDHGEMMGSQGVWPRQKQVPWAESVMVPFLLKYPKLYGEKGKTIDVPINTPDILPTLLSLAGLDIPESVEGQPMQAAIENPADFQDKVALVLNVSPFAGKVDEYRGVYTSRYAYVKSINGPWFLFDSEKDPLQMNNLLHQPGNEQLEKEMQELLDAELARIGDEFKPRDYYIDKWNYKLNDHGYIPYYFDKQINGPDSLSVLFQGPELNSRLD